MSLDKEFLEKTLRLPISSFLLSAGANPGDNVAGSLKRVKVTTATGETLNLVYKGVGVEPEQLDYATRFGIFRTETAMYQIVKPRVIELLKSRGAKRTDLPFPEFISSNYDGNFYLLLEDVRPDGYIMPDKFKGLNLDEVTLVLKEMARFHALTYFLIKHEGEKIFDEDEVIKSIRESIFAKDDPQMKAVGMLMFANEVKNSAELLKFKNHPDWAEKLLKTLNSEPEAVYKLIKRPSKLTDTVTFPCIIHGDLWLNNIMIKYDPSGKAIDLKFLDFQQSRRGNIFEDLQYFFMCSTTPQFRSQHFPQVLNTYYEAFVSTLEEIRCPIPLGFTRGSLIDTFYGGLLAAYFFMTFAIPLQLAEPLDMVAMAKAAQENGNGEVPNPAGAEGPENGLSMEENMAKNFAMRSQMMYMQMMKSPKALDRLVDITREMVEMKIL